MQALGRFPEDFEDSVENEPSRDAFVRLQAHLELPQSKLHCTVHFYWSHRGVVRTLKMFNPQLEHSAIKALVRDYYAEEGRSQYPWQATLRALLLGSDSVIRAAFDDALNRSDGRRLYSA